MNHTRTNKHPKTEFGPDMAFTGPVFLEPYTHENRGAHGDISYTETCRGCGWTRDLNQNGRHVEASPWGRAL